MARYADVIVNISREELDKSFQYRIPDELQEAVTLGRLPGARLISVLSLGRS